MTLTETEEVPETTIRVFKQGDEHVFSELLQHCFGSIEYLPRVNPEIAGAYLDRAGSFVAEKDGKPIGCVGLRNFPRKGWADIRYLAVSSRDSREQLGQTLVSKVMDYARSNSIERLKAFVPMVQPYVDVYKKAGFVPARRSLRISWDLSEPSKLDSDIETRLLSKEHANEAADVWVEGLRPYWDYWIEEQGGPEDLKSWVRESVGVENGWIGAFIDKRLVGLAILRPDAYGKGVGRFNGAYVLPQYREKRVGSALMKATIHEAQQLGQKKMIVYTLGFLDCFAPGALLYLKSGGKIDAEYLHFERKE